MALIINNQTANPLSYAGGNTTVAANSSTTVSPAFLFSTARDPQLISDCLNTIATLNDGVTDYGGRDAVEFLSNVAMGLGGAVVGFAGATTPSFQIQVGGKDANGKSQTFRMNQFFDMVMNYRNTYRNITGNATTTVKSGSGTLHGIMINNNASDGVAKLYDNTAGSGTVIATFQMGSPSGGLLSSSGLPGPVFLGPLGIEFTTGLTIVTSGSSSNDITAVYQ